MKVFNSCLKPVLTTGLFCLCLFSSISTYAKDIRADGPLSLVEGNYQYKFFSPSCGNIVSISDSQGVRQSDDFTPQIGGGCEVSFVSRSLQPSLLIEYLDGSKENYEEVFTIESSSPVIEEPVFSIQSIDGTQSLVVQFTASDNVDISYISYNLIGLFASDLKNSGGVIETASENAFVDTAGNIRIYHLRITKLIFP